MKTVAILAELNPFHNGHADLLAHAREKCGADAVIVLLSGDFVQRGQPAIISKTRRCRAALEAGADLVLELPVLYTLAPAEIYARGAIMTLEATGIVNELLFGSETGDLAALTRTADAVSTMEDDPGFIAQLLGAMSVGNPYPKALAQALHEKRSRIDHDKEPMELSKQAPNDILGVEYIRSINVLESRITPVCIKRTGRSGHVESATALRAMIRDPAPDPAARIASFVPAISLQELNDVAASAEESFVFSDDLSAYLKFRLLTSTAEEIAGIADIGNDLGQRIFGARLACDGFDSFASLLKVKAFTLARIRRALMQLILGITRAERRAMLCEKATLLRVLGFRENARHLLSAIAAMKTAPLIVRGADYHADHSPAEKRLIELALFAGSLYNSLSLRGCVRVSEEEKMPVIL